MSNPEKMKKDHYYWIIPEGGRPLVSAKWLGDRWDEVNPPKAPQVIRDIQPKNIIIGSKYNYTVQDGDSLVSYGFDSFSEMLDLIMELRKLKCN